VYNSAVLTDQNVAKFFDVNKVNNEKYTFVIAYDNKVFTKTL